MITKKNFSLKNYNSFNIDVNAKEFIEINSKEELIGLNGLLKNEKILFLGGGSNILFTKDYDGTVIYLNLKGIKIEKENTCLLYTSPSPRDQSGSRMPSSA